MFVVVFPRTILAEGEILNAEHLSLCEFRSSSEVVIFQLVHVASADTLFGCFSSEECPDAVCVCRRRGATALWSRSLVIGELDALVGSSSITPDVSLSNVLSSEFGGPGRALDT